MWFKEYSYDETNALQDLKEIYTSHDDNYIYRSVTNLEELTMNTYLLKYWINNLIKLALSFHLALHLLTYGDWDERANFN